MNKGATNIGLRIIATSAPPRYPKWEAYMAREKASVADVVCTVELFEALSAVLNAISRIPFTISDEGSF